MRNESYHACPVLGAFHDLNPLPPLGLVTRVFLQLASQVLYISSLTFLFNWSLLVSVSSLIFQPFLHPTSLSASIACIFRRNTILTNVKCELKLILLKYSDWSDPTGHAEVINDARLQGFLSWIVLLRPSSRLHFSLPIISLIQRYSIQHSCSIPISSHSPLSHSSTSMTVRPDPPHDFGDVLSKTSIRL